MRKNRSAALAAASFLLLSGAAIATAPSAYAGTPGGTHADDRNSDFNGDGYEDVLVGAPGATVSGKKGAGLVTVQYGSSRGIGTTHVARFSQSTSGVAGAAETGDAFGKAVATGDLDGDGYDDAVVGIPGEDIGTTADAGGVAVLWGSKAGLTGAAGDWLQAQEPTAGESSARASRRRTSRTTRRATSSPSSTATTWSSSPTTPRRSPRRRHPWSAAPRAACPNSPTSATSCPCL